MNDTEEKKTNGDPGGSGRGKVKWIWVALAVALGVVVFGKLAGKGPSACCGGGICPLPVAVAGSNAVPPAVASPAAAAVAPALGEKLPRLVDLGAGKCIPCKMMAPILEELRKTYTGTLEVQFVDVWEKPDEAKTYGIRMIPTQIFYDAAGQERFRHEGFIGREDILAKWKELGVELKTNSESRSQKPE